MKKDIEQYFKKNENSNKVTVNIVEKKVLDIEVDVAKKLRSHLKLN